MSDPAPGLSPDAETRRDEGEREGSAPDGRWWVRALAWGGLALGLLLAGFLGFQALRLLGPANQDTGPSTEVLAPLVEVVPARAQGRDYAVTADGFLRPVAQVGLAPEQPGRIDFVVDGLAAGARFEAGAVLVRLDDREARAEVARAEAERAAAVAALERTRTDEARQRRLAEIGAAPAARAEQATAELASAEARIQQADAALSVARERLEDTVLTAPFPATILSEDASLGAYVSPGQVVATLFDNTLAEMRVGVQPDEAAGIARARAEAGTGLRAILRPGDGSASTATLTAQVASVGTALDARARTVTVTLRVPGAFDPREDGLVFADDVMQAVIPARATDTLYAAPAGVLRRQSFVWTVKEDRLVRVAVEPLSEEDGLLTFAAASDLRGAPLLLTALSEEAEGTQVRLRRADDTRLAAEPDAADGSSRGGAAR